MMKLRTATIDDLEALQRLFVDSITEICKRDYNASQIKAWTASVHNSQRWLDMLTNQYVCLVEKESQIIGFCSLDQGSYIDFFYVHKDFQGQGAARCLYTHIEQLAIHKKQTTLNAQISKTARPFFEKIGFSVLQEQQVDVRGQTLTNYKMTKDLSLSESGN